MTQEAQAPAKKGCDGPGFILILVLTGFMFLYHQFFYAPQLEKYKQDLKQWEEEQKKKADEEAAAAEAAAVKSATVAGPGSSTTAPPGSKTVVQPEATPKGVAQKKTDHPRKDGIAFATPEHAVKLSTAGASLTALTFTRADDPAVLETTYAPKQSKEKDARKAGPFTPLHHYLDDVRSLAITPVAEDLAWVATADWAYAPGPDGSHVFSLTLPNGLILKKIYEPPVSQPSDDKAEKVELFHFRLRIQIENPTGTEQKFGYYLNGPAGMVEQEVGRAGGGQYAVMASLDKNNKIDDILSDAVSGMDTLKAPSESLKPEEASTKIAFFGLTTKYFCAVVAPLEETEVASAEAFGLLPYTGKTPDDASKEHPDGLGNQGLVRGLVKELTIKPNTTSEQRFMVYVGPRQQTSIFQQPIYSKQHFGELVYYGWFGTRSIGRLLGWVLGGLFSLVGNLGFAILFLTFLVRGLMLPLSMYSQRNMLRMQKIGPELNALKEKFAKPDGSMTPEQQRAFAAAQMDMFRKHNVNPVGCIGPIFLQMPIFIGLYNALNYSSWLRHQPFIGWITDLSIPDVLWRMPVTIPLLGTNALSVLPLLMIATYLLQMKVQPKPSDPKMAEQQKMMKWMYPVFGFILYTMPSGLMLYFITSSLWGIAEQKVIKSRIEEQESGGSKPDAKKSDLPGLAKTEKAAEPVNADANSGGGGGGGKKNKNKNKKKKR